MSTKTSTEMSKNLSNRVEMPKARRSVERIGERTRMLLWSKIAILPRVQLLQIILLMLRTYGKLKISLKSR